MHCFSALPWRAEALLPLPAPEKAAAMTGPAPNKDTLTNGITTIGEWTGYTPVPGTTQVMIGRAHAGARDTDMAGITPKAGITVTVGRRSGTTATMTATRDRMRAMAHIITAMFRPIA